MKFKWSYDLIEDAPSRLYKKDGRAFLVVKTEFGYDAYHLTAFRKNYLGRRKKLKQLVSELESVYWMHRKVNE